MLKNIHLQNFKSHHDTKVEFDGSRLHAIVGQNSVGKTSILQGIYTMICVNLYAHNQKIFRSPLAPQDSLREFTDYVNTLNDITDITKVLRNPQDFDSLVSLTTIDDSMSSLITSGKGEMCVKASGIHEEVTWEASCTWAKTKGNRVFGWRIGEEDEQQSTQMPKEQFPFSKLQHTVYLKLNANQLAEPSYSSATEPAIGNGDGLAPVLDYIRSESLETFVEIQTMLNTIVPSVNGIKVKRKTVKIEHPSCGRDMIEVTGHEIIFDMSGGQVAAHAASEGTILTVGLLATIMSPTRPNIILLDDLDQGLHPKAQIELVQLLKKIIENNPELQIIFTTHSPYILDELELSQVHVLHMDKNGCTVEKRLDEHTTSTWAKGVLTTGEFWDAEGEEWVLEKSEQEVVVDG